VKFEGRSGIGPLNDAAVGRKIKDGAREIKLFGETLKVNAEIESIDGFSAHADYRDLLWWIGNFKKKPKLVFVTHGEEESSLAFKEKLENEGFKAHVPHLFEEIEI
jgi:metallo-beta-lactamase family protein